MKKLIVFLAITFTTTSSYSQSIQFSSISWRDALAKAKREHKPLFVEVYTTWCTYCRQMERDVFTVKETGDYYNTRFINVRYDALQSDGMQVRKNYALSGFPTFLYLDPDGLVLVKTAGFQPVNKFISNADSASQILIKRKQ